tara:strand:+ start:190 stop:396 length:207 start_codon:yes stop_codon:yes gene_type:complete
MIKFHLQYFLLFLGISLFIVYIMDEPQKVVYIYPNKDNLDSYVYRTKDGHCYQAELIKRDCELRAKII